MQVTILIHRSHTMNLVGGLLRERGLSITGHDDKQRFIYGTVDDFNNLWMSGVEAVIPGHQNIQCETYRNDDAPRTDYKA